ncbi:transcriptional regulator [Mycolicibacterium arabiense]|uniref:Transcriptional regulator n=1 Tax=Mycolicibacterium arabiense TaxID=1286181 RepID=A0A7I7RYT4_9MYCO|nr:GAF and ANTAR domain-containing protein [Mycolicibacterium arabiense]MCV7374354.1 GAF and ANTAR domain-containing protein [Mycolicibacterium arabiense]BBY49613.1 transcriptional regulator [Mycolicibacterium arabiense]
MPFDATELAGHVESLLRQVQGGKTTAPETILGDLVATARSGVPAAGDVGITVASKRGDVRTLAATGPVAKVLDEIQRRHQEGPCVTAAWANHMVRVDDLGTDTRWPAYAKDASAQTSVRSILAFQLFADNQTMGALNFYADQPGAFDDEDVETGLLYATHTALAWNLVRRDEQYRGALASRDVIGQAKGILMERFSVDAVQAFDLLRRLSQQSNKPLVDIAHRVVENPGDATERRPPSAASHR